MLPLVLALLLPVLPGFAEEFGSAQIRRFQSAADSARGPEAEREFDETLAQWRRSLDYRLRRVESRCLNSPDLGRKACAEGGPYRIGGKPFLFDPSDSHAAAEKLVPAAKYARAGRDLGRFASQELDEASTWRQILGIAALAIFAPGRYEEWNRGLPATRMREALGEAKARYEDLRARTAARADALSLDAENRVALAACVSAQGFAGYNQAEADAVLTGTSDPFDAARRPWESFVVGRTPESIGRGVCRDYAAVADDFLKALGVSSKVVGSSGHAMVEARLAGRGADPVFLVEPQHDLLARDCLLYRYSPPDPAP